MAASREIAYTKKRKIKVVRKTIVAKYYKLGFTLRAILEKVKEEMGNDRISVSTIKYDIDDLLVEWQESRIEDTDLAIQTELQRNYDQMREAWEAWEKSKSDYKQRYQKQKGMTVNQQEIKTKEVERGEKDMINYGDPRYLAELRMLADQRIKLLGLNAPEKKELSGPKGEALFKSFDEFLDVCLKDAASEEGYHGNK